MKLGWCVTAVAVVSLLIGSGTDSVPAEPASEQDVKHSNAVGQDETAPSAEEAATTSADVLRQAEDALKIVIFAAYRGYPGTNSALNPWPQ